MRGDKKRRRCGFQRNHPYYGHKRLEASTNDEASVWQERMSHGVHEMVVRTDPGGNLVIPDAEGQTGRAKLLRPKPPQPSLCDRYLENRENSELKENRLLNVGKVVEMWNDSFHAHMLYNPDCTNPYITIKKEIKKGLGWKWILHCLKCTYVSKLYKLYKEVPKETCGAKAAQQNVAIHVALQDSPIGIKKAQLLFAATDTPAPSKTAMQRMADHVGRQTVALNKASMSSAKENMKLVNALRGLPERSSIRIKGDVRYDTIRITSRNKCGQAANQAVGLVCSDYTDRGEILGMYMENKLCWTGAWLRGKGFDVKCPGGHVNCTATVSKTEPLSEKKIGAEIGKSFVLKDLLIKYAVTDGDGKLAEGINEAMNAYDPDQTVKRLSDTIHLGQSQFKAAQKAQFSSGMFDGRTRADKTEVKKYLAADLKDRSTMIVNYLFKLYLGDFNKICKKLPKVIDATIDCYSGDCRMCRRNSLVCGGGKTNSWWNRSKNFSADITGFNMDDGDKILMREILKVKLSETALENMKFNSNTQRNESLNRAMSVSLPKNVNFSRNYEARAHSVVHRITHGIADSTHLKLENLGVPLTVGGQAARTLKQMDRDEKYQKNYARRQDVKNKRFRDRKKEICDFKASKKVRKLNTDTYRKGQLDAKVKLTRSKKKADHIYSKLSK